MKKSMKELSPLAAEIAAALSPVLSSLAAESGSPPFNDLPPPQEPEPEDHTPPWLMIRIGQRHVECVPPLSLRPTSSCIIWQRGGGGYLGLYVGQWRRDRDNWTWEGQSGADLLRDLSQDIRTLAQCSVQLMTDAEAGEVYPIIPMYPSSRSAAEDSEVQQLLARLPKNKPSL